MATNDFKPFAVGSNANVTSQTDYESLAALATGFQAGKASSAQVNKAIRQGSVMASVLAQFIADNAKVDVLDDGDFSVILSNLVKALDNNASESFLKIDNRLKEIAQLGTTAQATSRTNLGLGSVSTLDVGTGTGQVPSMEAFVGAGSSSVFSSIVIAGNRRIMEGNGSGTFSSGVLSFTLPLAFPSVNFTIIFTDVGSGVVSYAATPASGSVVTIYGKDAAGNKLGGLYGFKFIAMGSAT